MSSDKKIEEGMPNPDTVVETREFVSPKGRKYTFLKTAQTDATDKPLPPPAKKSPKG